MSIIATKDGAEIYYKDWGEGPVETFSHGWPLNSDACDGQKRFLVQNAHDRRGHGRLSRASSNNDMNGYADDLAAVIDALNLGNATPVGHSTGGDVARYIGGHGSRRVAKAVLVAAVPPSRPVCLHKIVTAWGIQPSLGLRAPVVDKEG